MEYKTGADGKVMLDERGQPIKEQINALNAATLNSSVNAIESLTNVFAPGVGSKATTAVSNTMMKGATTTLQTAIRSGSDDAIRIASQQFARQATISNVTSTVVGGVANSAWQTTGGLVSQTWKAQATDGINSQEAAALWKQGRDGLIQTAIGGPLNSIPGIATSGMNSGSGPN